MIKPTSTAYRIAVSGMACVLACAAAAFADPAPDPNPNDPQSNWLRIVPGDAGFYAEMRDLAGIRDLFRKFGIWNTIRELTDRSVPPTTTKPWAKATEEDLGLEPEDAITRLLGRRAALIATHSSRWQSGVVLVELSDVADLRYWLRQWRSRRLADEGLVRRYELQGGILLASLGRTLVLGPAEDPDGLWGRTVLLLSGRRGPMLAGRAEFAALQTRLTRDYAGLLYVVWPEGDPTAVEKCTRMVVGLSVTEDAIECELRGQRTGTHEAPPIVNLDLLGMLPTSTWAARADSYDFAEAAQPVLEGDAPRGDAMLMLMLAAFSGNDESGNLLRDIGPGFVIACDDNRSGASRKLLRLPSVAVVCEARNGETHAERLELLVTLVSQALSWAISPRSDADLETPPVRKVELDSAVIRVADLGGPLARRTGLPFLDSVSICWTHLDGRLIVTTSEDHIRRIVMAASSKRGRLIDTRDWQHVFPHKDGDEPIAEWMFIKGKELSRVLLTWVGYIRKDHPDAMSAEFWQAWARSRLQERGRLGIGLINDPARKNAAVVREVSIQSPAAGLLLPGDAVVSVSGRALDTDNPAREVAERYAARGRATVFEVGVIRNDKPISVRVPVYPSNPLDLRSFDPLRAIRHIIVLTQRTQSITAWRYATPSDRYDAKILIRWSKPRKSTR